MPALKNTPLVSKTRGGFLGATAALALAGIAGVVTTTSEPAFAQSPPAQSPMVPVDQLMAPQALPDIVQGKADAPITIVEYASMTCPHCAAFHAQSYPALKSNYIDTGKVRFILREFPLDSLAAAAFMLARCAGPDKRSAMVDILFDQQQSWAFSDQPLAGLSKIAKETGMSEASFEACINDKNLYDKVMQVDANASAKFGIDSTPTFFINGKRYGGELSTDALDKILDPLLKK